MSSRKNSKRSGQEKPEAPKAPPDNLIDLFDELRTGAANVAGVTFQVALSAFLLATGRAGNDPGLPVIAVRPEGFEDVDCQLANGTWLFVQAKERGLDARNIAAAELAEILAHAAQALRLTEREMKLEREEAGDEEGSAAIATSDGSRTGSGDCHLAVVTNGAFGSSLPVTSWSRTLEAALAEPGIPTKTADALTGALRQKLADVGLPASLAAFVLRRTHLVVIKESMGQTTTDLLESGLGISPVLASVVRPHLICDLAEVAAAQRESSLESGALRHVGDLNVMATRLARKFDVASLEEAVRAGVCEPVDFVHPSAHDAQKFYAGVRVSPGHIAAGLDVVRPLEVSQVVNGLSDRGHVVITGPSGSGKSALLWRAAKLLESGPRLVRVLRVADSVDAELLVGHVLRAEPSFERAIIICIDDLGRPKTAAWAEARDRLLELPGVRILGAARREDLSPALSKGADLVDATLTESGATQVYQAVQSSGMSLVLAQEEAVGKAGGLLMEFIALATTGHHLREVLADQVAVLSVPERHLDRMLLRLICAAHTLGFEVAADALTAAIGQPEEQVSDALRRLAGEHLVTSTASESWRGLHDLRAEVLLELLHTAPPPTLATTYARAVGVLPGPARPTALRRAAVRIARLASAAHGSDSPTQRLEAINQALSPLAQCIGTQLRQVQSASEPGRAVIVAGMLEAADRLDSIAQVYASLPLVAANATPNTDVANLMWCAFMASDGLNVDLPQWEPIKALAARLPARTEQAAAAAALVLTAAQLSALICEAQLPIAIRLSEAAEGYVTLTADQAEAAYRHHLPAFPNPPGSDRDLINADHRAQLTASLASLASLRGPAVSAVFGDVSLRAEDAVASDPFGCAVTVGWQPVIELGEPSTGLARSWTYTEQQACVIRAVAFAHPAEDVPPSAYHGQPGQDRTDDNGQAVHLAERVFDACPEADLVKVEIWHAHAQPRVISGISDGVKTLRAGVLRRARATSRNVARQAATMEAFGSENWTARCRAQAQLAAELLSLLAELPSRLRPNDRNSQREAWTQRAQHAHEIAVDLPVRPSEVPPLASTVQAAALSQTAAEVDEELRSTANEDYSRKALIRIAECLLQVADSKNNLQGIHGAGARLHGALSNLLLARGQGLPAYSGIGETLPAALEGTAVRAARLLSAVDKPLVAKALRSGVKEYGRLDEVLAETMESVVKDAVSSTTELLARSNVTPLLSATTPEPEPLPAWRTQQVVFGVPLTQWPDTLQALREWSASDRETANVQCRIAFLPIEEGEVLPMAIRVSGGYGGALPIPEDEIPVLAESLGIPLRKGNVQAALHGPQTKLKECSYFLVRRAHRPASWSTAPAQPTTPDLIANEIALVYKDLLSRTEDADQLPVREQMQLLAVMATLELSALVAKEDGHSLGLAGGLASLDVAHPAISEENRPIQLLNFAITAAIEADKNM